MSINVYLTKDVYHIFSIYMETVIYMYRDGNLSTSFFKTIRFTKLDDQNMLPHLSKYPDSALSLLLFSLR